MSKVSKTSVMMKTTTKTTISSKKNSRQATSPSLAFYNYWTRQREPFVPTQLPVGLYSCGLTAYEAGHIGNFRTFLFEDVLARTLTYFDYSVHQVMNITDVDDKTIRAAAAQGVSLATFTRPWIERFFDDSAKLGLRPAAVYPRATEHIAEMIVLIEHLVRREIAYVVDGSVYFAIRKFPAYGRLSQVDLRHLRAGARVQADEYTKEAVEDFVLWKAAKPDDEAVGAAWDSPWGRGRPGWHIECSAMSMKYLGETFDLHAGAIDLLFPHHEDEVAQSEGATGRPFARFFLEAEHLLVDGVKMAKSVGNFYTLADVIEHGFEPAAFRYLMLSAHYRSKLNFTWESLTAASQALTHVRQGQYRPAPPIEVQTVVAIEAALADDLDTPKAIALLQTADNPALWQQFDVIFGFGLTGKQPLADRAVKDLLKKREVARQARDFAKADELRAKINSLGWEIEDTDNGPRLVPYQK